MAPCPPAPRDVSLENTIGEIWVTLERLEQRLAATTAEPDFTLDSKIEHMRRRVERTIWQATMAIIFTQICLVGLMAAVLLGTAQATGHS
jgi:hypothetical protein